MFQTQHSRPAKLVQQPVQTTSKSQLLVSIKSSYVFKKATEIKGHISVLKESTLSYILLKNISYFRYFPANVRNRHYCPSRTC